MASLIGIPIQIDYSYMRVGNPVIVMVEENGETFFRFDPHPRRSASQKAAEFPRTFRPDPYQIRREFEAVDSPIGALKFLNRAGDFWPFFQITWSQFREWQRFLALIREDNVFELTRSDNEAREVLNAMLGRPNQFFSIRNRPEAGLRKSTGPRDLEQHLRQEDMEWQVRTKSEQLFHELPTLFLHPKIRIDHASGHHTTESKRLDWTSISRKDLIPVLRIEARHALAAIGATVCADRWNGTEYRRCPACKRLFLKKGETKTHCCQKCNLAHRAERKRVAENEAVDFFISASMRGASKKEVEREARRLNITLTKRATERAKAKLTRKKRSSH
jgi:hypothetical protein